MNENPSNHYFIPVISKFLQFILGNWKTVKILGNTPLPTLTLTLPWGKFPNTLWVNSPSVLLKNFFLSIIFQAYLTALLAIMSNVSECSIYSVSDRQLTKQDMGQLHPFFKQGVYEYTKNESDFSPWNEASEKQPVQDSIFKGKSLEVDTTLWGQ